MIMEFLPMIKPILLLSTFLAVVGIFVIKNFFSTKEEKKKYHPIGGTIFHLLLKFNHMYDYLTDLTHKNLTFRILYLGKSEIFTSDPANIEYFLKTNFANYGKGSYHHDILEGLLGDGIFTVDGEKWRQQRKISSHEFSTRNLREFSSGVFKTNAAKLAEIVAAAATSNQTIEIQDLFMKSAMDSVFKVVLGVDLDSLSGTNEGAQFSNAFDEASEMTCYRYVDKSWPLKKFLNIGSEATLKKSMNVVDDFVCKVNKGDILTRFLQMDETDPKYLKDIILSFIIAGKDTTASTLSWFFYMMCKYPSIQEKIVKEVREATKINKRSSIEEIAQSISEEALDKMQFLHAAITYVPYAMGRIKSLWGEDAEEFKPNRWLDENGKYQQESSFKFTAFQAGPRICLGKEFAYRQMKVFASVLLSAFSFKMADENKAVNYRTMLTLQIDGGLYLLASLVAIYIIKIVLSRKKEKKKYHPIGGTKFHLLLNFNNLYDYLTDLTHKNLTFRILCLDNNEIFTSDPANIEYFLKTNFANYGKGSYHHDVLEGLLGDGIFTVDGERWRHQRKISSYEFSTRNLREFSSGVFKTNAAKLAEIVAATTTSNQTIEIQVKLLPFINILQNLEIRRK
ncbi:hypothetical protein ACJIZ3_009289 [Penstemon smallii]|uniref:Cytochrome P450 n=1 Tax=Penstemon smallii TaxID=265156 RepID=A0ABD3TDU3_9LAMI